MAAPPNALLNGSVQPGSGTTSTTFVFSVRYRSAGERADSVTAVAGNVVIPLSLISGQPADGRYRGSASLPEGSWDVVFQAAVAKGNDPSLGGPTVTVTLAPPPPSAYATTHPAADPAADAATVSALRPPAHVVSPAFRCAPDDRARRLRTPPPPSQRDARPRRRRCRARAETDMRQRAAW